ncbi:MAG: iron complex transport system ATP-binding protein [Chloroflexi bacterium]|nr:MAG: iron complex transport system ATP-binding protein [Chloroflexota bacterium]MBA4374951.1 ferric citrate ABC transporter ATP-binding protein FecE [Anaerolinea sp.]
MLTIKKICAGYNGKIILKEISLNVAQGSVIALIGPNGSGKTTLIRTVSGVLPPASGDLLFNREDLTALSVQERSRVIAVVPQMRTLPPAFTVREAVTLGRTPYLNWLGQISDHDLEIINQALTQTDLLDLAERNIGELSGGEQQRVLLARALAQQTPVLLLDEPTAHLDLQYQVSFLEKVYRLAHPSLDEINNGIEKRAVLVAIHDLNLLSRYADQVALMVNGRLECLGTPAEVLRPEILSKAYNLPLTIIQDQGSGLSAVLPDQRPFEL